MSCQKVTLQIIINYLFDRLKLIDRCYRNYKDKNIETIMLEYHKVLQLCNARKANIVCYDPVTTSIEIVEITICYDLYFEQVLNGKDKKYIHLLNVLENLGFTVKMHVLCSDPWGMSKKIVLKLFKRFTKVVKKEKYIEMVLCIHYYWSKLYLAK